MSSLILKKGGILQKKKWIYDEETEIGRYQYFDISLESQESNLFYILHDIIELDDDIIVRDWFNLIKNYPTFIKLDPFIEEYFKEFDKCPKEGCIDPELEEIVLQKFIQIENYEDSQKGLFECEIFIDISGKFKDETFGLDFLPLQDYLDLPLKLLNGKYIKTIESNTSKKFEVITEDLKINYTLYEFITSFIYEISFYGSPENRNLKGKELNESMERSKEAFVGAGCCGKEKVI